MAKRPLPSPEVLRQLIRYVPETGEFFWNERPREFFPNERVWRSWNSRRAGTRAFAQTEYGSSSVLNVKCKAHRVAWAIYHGAWPDGCIDHVNGNPEDQRIENLRLATKSENAMNRKVPANSTSGFKGVSWDTEARKWKAHIKRGGFKKNLGRFHCPIDAARAYNTAAKDLFGDFALLNEIPSA